MTSPLMPDVTEQPVTAVNGMAVNHGARGMRLADDSSELAFSIAADELAAWEERLAAADIAIEGRTKWPRGGKSVYFRDPDGHLLELATPGLWPGY